MLVHKLPPVLMDFQWCSMEGNPWFNNVWIWVADIVHRKSADEAIYSPERTSSLPVSHPFLRSCPFMKWHLPQYIFWISFSWRFSRGSWDVVWPTRLDFTVHLPRKTFSYWRPTDSRGILSVLWKIGIEKLTLNVFCWPTQLVSS